MPLPSLSQLAAHYDRDPRKEAIDMGIVPGFPVKKALQQDKLKRKKAKVKNAHVAINKSCVSFSVPAFRWMGATKVEIGYMTYKGQIVPTFTPSDKGASIYDYFTRPSIVSRPTLARLFAAGVEPGSYELCRQKSDGTYIAIPLWEGGEVMRLWISDHALQRWHERVGPVCKKEIRKLVTSRLRTQLRLGLKACDKDAFQLDIFPDLRAVLAIDVTGCWVVETFFRVFPGQSEVSTESEEVEPWDGNL